MVKVLFHFYKGTNNTLNTNSKDLISTTPNYYQSLSNPLKKFPKIIHQNQVSQSEIAGKYNRKLNCVTRKLSKTQQVSYVQGTYNFVILESRTIHEHESTILIVMFKFNFSCCPYCVFVVLTCPKVPSFINERCLPHRKIHVAFCFVYCVFISYKKDHILISLPWQYIRPYRLFRRVF